MPSYDRLGRSDAIEALSEGFGSVDDRWGRQT
jgi:hypothetical protein